MCTTCVPLFKCKDDIYIAFMNTPDSLIQPL